MNEPLETPLDRLLQDEATPEGHRRLEAALREDADLRRAWLVHAGFEAALPAALRDVRAAQAAAVGRPSSPSAGRGEDRPGGHSLVRRWLAWAACVALVAGTVAGLWGGRRAPAPETHPNPAGVASGKVVPSAVAGRVVCRRGQVLVGRAAGGAPEEVDAGGRDVAPGDSVIVSAESEADFVAADGSRFRLYARSALEVPRESADRRLVLLRGALDATVVAQREGGRWQVGSALLRVEVIGTEFRLAVDARSAWLGVREGTVQALRVDDGGQLVLERGQYATVSPGWPFSRMDARVCPIWKSVCRQATGSEYP